MLELQDASSRDGVLILPGRLSPIAGWRTEIVELTKRRLGAVVVASVRVVEPLVLPFEQALGFAPAIGCGEKVGVPSFGAKDERVGGPERVHEDARPVLKQLVRPGGILPRLENAGMPDLRPSDPGMPGREGSAGGLHGSHEERVGFGEPTGLVHGLRTEGETCRDDGVRRLQDATGDREGLGGERIGRSEVGVVDDGREVAEGKDELRVIAPEKLPLHRDRLAEKRFGAFELTEALQGHPEIIEQEGEVGVGRRQVGALEREEVLEHGHGRLQSAGFLEEEREMLERGPSRGFDLWICGPDLRGEDT